MVLLSTVLITAASLSISFKKFYFDFVQRQAEIGEVSLAALEDIVSKLAVANQATVSANGSRIDIRVDTDETPGDFTDDTTHTYWLTGGTIQYQHTVDGATSEARTLAVSITNLSFAPLSNNLVVNGDFSDGDTGFSSYVFATPCTAAGRWSFPIATADPATSFTATSCYPFLDEFGLFRDHTSGGGNMMVVNGARDDNLAVWTQTIQVLPNTDYVFSAFCASCTDNNPARLRITINGMLQPPLIQLPTLAKHTHGSWLRFSRAWNSGNNTTALISIFDNVERGPGNDFALDDISFTPPLNRIKIRINMQYPDSPEQHFETTAVMRCRCAQDLP